MNPCSSLKLNFNPINCLIDFPLRREGENSLSGHGMKLLRMASSAGQSFSKQLSRVFAEKIQKDSLNQMKNMNLAIYEDELRELRSKGVVDLFFIFIAIFSGAVCMYFIEGWHFDDSFYWACVTVRAFNSMASIADDCH